MYLSTPGVQKSGDVYKSSEAPNEPRRGVAQRLDFQLGVGGGVSVRPLPNRLNNYATLPVKYLSVSFLSLNHPIYKALHPLQYLFLFPFSHRQNNRINEKTLKNAMVGISRGIWWSNRETRRFDEKLGDSQQNQESWQVSTLSLARGTNQQFYCTAVIIYNKLDNYFIVSANRQTFLGFEMTANLHDTSPLTTPF